MKFKERKGISLIALIITIIILLILAGITMGILTGENGLISNAEKAKEDSEIADEKEIVQKAAVLAIGRNKYGELEEEKYREELEREVGIENIELSNLGEMFEVYFKESERYYEVDNNGSVSNPSKAVEDKYPGDITKDAQGNELDGSSDKPYEINCIEDLVALSNIVNRDGKIIENGDPVEANRYWTIYGGFNQKTIVLNKTLDFKSNRSYVDPKRIDFGDVNSDGITQTLKEELLNGIGFIPIGAVNTFLGTFDGKNNEIQNIYQKREDIAGLFGEVGGHNVKQTIKNIGVSGKITGKKHVGGVIAKIRYIGEDGEMTIENCKNKAKIYNYENPTGVSIYGIGGILGSNSLAQGKQKIYNCCNYGDIYSESTNSYDGIGGIVGNDYQKSIIIDSCYNKGTIIGNENNTAGIIGKGGKIICNSGNEENVTGAGIARNAEADILNCYNIGKTTSSGICTNGFNMDIVIKNVYTTDNVGDKPIIKNANGKTKDIVNAFYSEACKYSDESGIGISEARMKSDGKSDTAQTQEKALITMLNEYVDIYNEENENTQEFIRLKIWKIDEKTGYPTFK